MARPKPKVFLDTSALIAGIASPKGAARELLRLAEIGLIEIVVSRQVIVEADRNITEKLSECLDDFRAYLEALAPVLADDPSARAVKQVASLINSDDAPVLAAAVAAKTDYLVTWDRRHFLTKGPRALARPKVMTPGEFLHEFRVLIGEEK
jgi:putative PIN family toxin of toxin-antitoxin system